ALRRALNRINVGTKIR
ncbi:MAG: hypothetical protein ACTH91_04485, partial [Streptococcus thermophilus]